MNPYPVPAIFVIDLQEGNKNIFFFYGSGSSNSFFASQCGPDFATLVQKKFHNACLYDSYFIIPKLFGNPILEYNMTGQD
jgi:hypothetical protein